MTATTSKLGADMLTDEQRDRLLLTADSLARSANPIDRESGAALRALLARQPAPSVEQDERGALIRAFDASLSGVPRYVIDRFGVEHVADGGGWIKESDLFDRFAASTSANVAQLDMSLEARLTDAEADVKRLHAEKMELWNQVHGYSANVAQGAEAIYQAKIIVDPKWTDVAKSEFDNYVELGGFDTRVVYTAPPAQTALTDKLQAEVERLNSIINTPHADDFLRAVSIEAEHQRQRWGTEGDAGKTPADWFWLVGYLGGKALHAHAANNTEKAEHHIITTAAALANWHRNMFGKTDMRPGIDGDAALTAAQSASGDTKP